jgi:vitamin B12 transporter
LGDNKNRELNRKRIITGLKTATIAVIVVCCNNVLAQTTSDTTLQEIKVSAKHNVAADAKLNDFAPGQKVQTIDSITLQQYRQQNIADLLSQQVPVFIKSYGFNGLTTLSFRGSSVAQSQVYWNGVPIQNAALGVADISTLPVLFVNKVNIVYGGSAALWGSGNVGGALMLENDAPVFDSGRRSLSVSGGAGSFNQYTGGLKGSLATKRWYVGGTVFAQNASNNFPYTTASGVTANMPNDHLHSYAGMAEAAYKISERNIVKLTAWYQNYDRQIPPALFESGSSKEQKSNSLRLLADWKMQKQNSSWYAKSSLLKDDVRYTDDALMLRSDNTVYQYFQELGWKKRLGENSQLLLFSPVQLVWMTLPATNEVKQQNRVALAAAYDYKHFNDRLDIALNARAEVVNSQSILLPGASAYFALTHWLSIRVNGQRTYRVPTLNELYFDPGGNASLKPEQGWNEDAGYTLKLKKGSFAFYHDVAVFNRDIKDWIVWLGGAIWTPHNIASVHSRGVETDNKITLESGKWTFHIGLNTAYILSTTTASYILNDGSVGKQIPYAPRYNGRINAGVRIGNLSANYIHTYTGYRFITSDESEYLLPYQTGNIQVLFDTHLRHNPVQITAQVNNIWNEHYVFAALRPMPGINWLAGFRFTIL